MCTCKYTCNCVCSYVICVSVLLSLYFPLCFYMLWVSVFQDLLMHEYVLVFVYCIHVCVRIVKHWLNHIFHVTINLRMFSFTDQITNNLDDQSKVCYFENLGTVLKVHYQYWLILLDFTIIWTRTWTQIYKIWLSIHTKF